MKRERADVLLVRQGLVSSRSEGCAAILAGEVTVDGTPVVKPGQQLSVEAELQVSSGPAFVSRGGIKLARALDLFDIHPAGMFAVDVGASTGGFTDCLLQRGADAVTAIDVGYGQLAWSLRNDPRVTVLERTNVRHVDPAEIGAADLVVVDVSFISVRKILPVLVGLLGGEGILLVLVKPQFEGERRHVGKGGVVRDRSVHLHILGSFAEAVVDAGLDVRGLTYSPITGADGNIEFWLYATLGASREAAGNHLMESVQRTVDEAHAVLGRAGERRP